MLFYLCLFSVFLVSICNGANLNVYNPSGKCISPLYTIKNITGGQCYKVNEPNIKAIMINQRFNCSLYNVYRYKMVAYIDSKCRDRVIDNSVLYSFNCSRLSIGHNYLSNNYYEITDTAQRPAYIPLAMYPCGRSEGCYTPSQFVVMYPGNCYSTGSFPIYAIWFVGALSEKGFNYMSIVSYNGTSCEGFGDTLIFNRYLAPCTQISYKFLNQNFTISSPNFFLFTAPQPQPSSTYTNLS
jgi:hypothetical protein